MGMIEDDYHPPPDNALSQSPPRKSLAFKMPNPGLATSGYKIFDLTVDTNNVSENLIGSALEQNVNTPHTNTDAGLSGLREINGLAVIGKPSIASRRML
jgi:hypothetical protein